MSFGFTPNDTTSIKAADFNNDRDPSLRLLAGVGDGNFSTLTARIPLPSGVAGSFVTGDFDGDGNTDLALWRQFTCGDNDLKVFILSGNENTLLSEKVSRSERGQLSWMDGAN